MEASPARPYPGGWLPHGSFSRGEARSPEYVHDVRWESPSVGLPVQTDSQGVGGIRHIKLEYSTATGSSLAAACKQYGFSVASPVHAAIVIATQEMAQPSPLAKNYTSVVSYNYRPCLEGPNDDAQVQPMGCNMLGLPFTLPLAEFMNQARELHKVYHQPLRRSAARLRSLRPIIASATRWQSHYHSRHRQTRLYPPSPS